MRAEKRPRPNQGRVGVIGDLVSSKRAPSRRDLQRRLEEALRAANHLVRAVDPLEVTIGDEFQGLYNTIDDALAATLVVQLKLGYDGVRFGIGAGHLSVYDRTRVPYGQDGPVWWAARAAIDEMDERQQQLRTVFVSSYAVRDRARQRSRRSEHGKSRSVSWVQLQLPGLDDGIPPERTTVYFDINVLINALLIGRDSLLAHFDERDRAIAFGLVEGRTQREIGDDLGMSQSAVSQRLSRSGAESLAYSFKMLSSAAL